MALVLGLTGGLAGWRAAADPPQAAGMDNRRPNIVFLLTDDMGYSDPGCYGGKFVPTPNIDRLAAEGTRYTHFYVNAPLCSPSRAAFLTGMFPARWNFTNFLDNRARNLDSEQADFLTTSAPALARALKAGGYATAHYGKWHLGGGRDVKDAPPFRAYGYDEHVGTYESPEPDPKITATNWIWSPQDPVKRWERTGYFVDHALDFMRRHRDGPCYVEVWPDDVHTPWVPSLEKEGQKGQYESRANFCEVLAEYDRQVGRLLDGIKALGLEDNTLFVFTSDNGPLPSFQHERTGGLRGSKLSLYEGGVRVPFIVRWPGHTPAGRVDERTVIEGVDLFPTLCAVTKTAMPGGFRYDGQDMTGALEAKPDAGARAIFWEYGRAGARSFNYPKPPRDVSPHLAVREGKWKLLVNADGGGAELYNLEMDANEAVDLAPQEAETTDRLREAALGWKRTLPTLGGKPGATPAEPAKMEQAHGG